MRRILLLAVVLSAVAASPSPALADNEVGARGMYWFPDLSGDVVSSAPGIPGTEFSIENDLRMENDNFPAGEAFVRFGRIQFRVGYTPVKFDGSNSLARRIVFNGQTFNVSDDVVSHLELKMFDGEVQFDFIRPEFGIAGLNLGVIVKVKYVDGTVELRSTTVTETKDFKAPIPMVGVAAGAGFLNDLVRADARVAGIAYSGNHLVEADAYVSFAPIPLFRVQGGYRVIDLKIDDDDIVATVKLKGPYVGAQLSF